MSSLEVSKAVVLRARELLMKVPNARLLSKEEFVGVCLDAAKRFLHDRRRASPRAGGGGGGGGRTSTTSPRSGASGAPQSFDSPRDEYLLAKLLEAEVERRVGVLAAERKEYQQQHPLYKAAGEQEDDEEMYSAPPPLGDRVVAQQDSFRNAPQTTQSNGAYSTPRRGGGHPRSQTAAASTAAYSVLHPIQIAAVHFVKRMLDPVYVKGMMTKQEYTDAVLSITTEGFALAQRQELDLAPSYVDEQYVDDDDARSQRSLELSEAFAAVLQEISASVAYHYTSRYEVTREAANVVAHEAVKTTHGVSIRPRSRSPSHTNSPGAHHLQPPAIASGTHDTRGARELRGDGNHAAPASSRHNSAAVTLGAPFRRSGSLGEASTGSFNRHNMGVDEDESVFDAQVEHIRNLLSTSSAAQNGATATSSVDNVTGITHTTVEGDDAAHARSPRRRRRQVLESELKLLSVEMNTLAQRAFKIREELAALER